jgi:hypothetical protein
MIAASVEYIAAKVPAPAIEGGQGDQGDQPAEHRRRDPLRATRIDLIAPPITDVG